MKTLPAPVGSDRATYVGLALVVLGLLFALFAPALLEGCAGSQPSPAVALAEAEGKCVAVRTAKQVFCSAQFSTRSEIDACITGVQNALDCTDGGVQQFITTTKDAGAQ